MATANIAQTKVVPVATTLTPYYDDFDENKNFHRILFRPGYAVQARELTQLQTILQNQIERFGNHIFQNGSLVLGGAMTLDNKAIYINLQSTYANTAVIASDFKDNVVTHSSGNGYVRAYVFGTAESTSTEPPVLVIKYLTGNEFGNTATIKTDVANGSNAFANIATSAHTGSGTLVSINDGIFFINGYFVKVPSQTVVVDKYSTQANAKIGLEYSEEIVTDVNDATLLDPAQEASNYQAPGAARLKVNFNLAVRSLSSADDTSFVEMMRVENGVIKKQIQYPIYSSLGDTLARRTFDESGNYTVRRFNLAIDDHPTDNTKLQLLVSPGKAYIKGYEYESIAQEKIDLVKARTTQDANNRDITINFGNYLYLSNVVGGFATANTMETVDLHSLTYNLVTTASHAQTKIGTARTRELRYDRTATTTSDANGFIYTLSIFDTQFTNLTSNVVSTTSTSIVAFDNTNKFSNRDDAYNGATLRFISGTGVGERYTVTDYTGSTKTFTISPNLVTTPTAATQFSLDFNIKMLDSISNQANTRSANVSVLSKDTGTRGGNTFLTDTTFNSLVYRLPDSFIRKGLSRQEFTFYRLESQTFSTTSYTITLPSGQSFVGTSDTTGRSAVTLDAFQVFRENGTRLNLSSVTVDNSAPNPTAIITNADGYTGAAVFYSLVKDTNVGARTKQQVTGNQNLFIPTNTLSGTFETRLSTVTSNTQVYLADGQVLIRNPSRVPNEKMSLFVSDVNRLQKVYDLNGAAVPAFNTSITGLTDVTSFFTFDNGQHDSHYDHASIALTPRSTGFVGPLIVVFDYYNTPTSPQGYFSVDSYPSYEDIPSYTDSNGNIISLRDAIDFRPIRTNATNTSPAYTITGSRIPKSGTPFEADYAFFVGKKAHLTLTTDWSQPFKVVEGTSAKNPSEPRLSENAMLLYKLTLDPYTINRSNIRTQFVENKRYTMRDIGSLETRIENLEYYQSLSLLEAAADRMRILDANGLERTKYGFIADDFTSHNFSDVDNIDYLISVDRAIGGAQPAQDTIVMPIVENSNTGIKTLGPYTTLSFTEEKLVTQNLASKFVPVQPYMISQWVGNMNMNPPDDIWVDTIKGPDVVINPNGQNDALQSTDRTANNSSQINSRARRRRANNAFVTETNWWTRQFGSPPDRS